MAGSFTAVDLSRLPFPELVEPLSVEQIVAEAITKLRELAPEFTALVESDPLFKAIEVMAYREFLLRQRVNEAVKGVTLAHARGADLDQIAARYNVQRLLLDPGDPSALPPVPPTWEPDDDLRRRVQLAFEGLSTAGPMGAYLFHALGADPDVSDCAAISDTPGIVDVYVLSRGTSGVPSPSTIDAVQRALSADDVRPLTDLVRVFPVDVVEYTVEAEIEVFAGPDAAVVLAASRHAVESYVTEHRKIGLNVARSGLFAALHGAGVRNVQLIQPAADVVVTPKQVAICTGVSVRLAG